MMILVPFTQNSQIWGGGGGECIVYMVSGDRKEPYQVGTDRH